MDTFMLQLIVAVSPMVMLVAAANLSPLHPGRNVKAFFRGRHTRKGILRALACGIWYR